MVEEKKADQGTVATENENENEKVFKWQELPFVSRKSLWDPQKQISAKSRLSKDLIGEEFALAYLKLQKEEWPRVGLVSLYFIARDMAKGMCLDDGCSGIERSFFDMIDTILRKYCLDRITIDALKEWNRSRLFSYLVRGDYPKTWQLEAIKTMGTLDELLWKKKL